MSDILSQEQIDALLASDQFEAGASDSDTSVPDTQRKNSALSGFFNSFCTQAGTVISTVISKNTVLTAQEPKKADFAAVNSSVNSAVLSLDLNFKSGIDGDIYLIMAKKDVAVLSDLMTMGDGTAQYSEDHKDAIGEILNQVMGAFCNAASTEFGTAISSGGATVNEFDLDNPPLTADSLDMVMTSLSLDGASEPSNVAFLVPESFSEQIIKLSPQSESSVSSSDQVGLSMPELDDLSKVTSFNSSDDFQETSLTGEQLKSSDSKIDMLLDIELDVSIELGRSLLSIKRVLELAPGSIVELDRMAGEPVDLLVNNKVVAKGEVVVIDESFGIRIVSLVSAEDRIRSLR